MRDSNLLYLSDGKSCSKCGCCCKEFHMDTSAVNCSSPDDPLFESWANKYLKYVREFTQEELTRMYELNVSPKGRAVFTCTALLSDNTCSIYEDRPYTCSGYPFYGKETIRKSSLAKNCGYL